MSRSIKIILVVLFCTTLSLWWRICFTSSSYVPELFFLPVGQGDAQLVRMGTVTVLIDGGPNKSVMNSLDSLLGAGTCIDAIFVSHGQTDHINGLFEVLSSRPVRVFLYQGEPTSLLKQLLTRAQERGVSIIKVDTGDTLQYQSSTLKVLSSAQEISTTASNAINDDSMVLKFTTGDACALFTADIGFTAEKQLLAQYGDQLDCEVLKVAHHGSKTSSLTEFLKQVSPVVSVIEVGKNSYGHPTKEALARLAEVGSKIFRTDQDGILRVGFKENAIELSSTKVE